MTVVARESLEIGWKRYSSTRAIRAVGYFHTCDLQGYQLFTEISRVSGPPVSFASSAYRLRKLAQVHRSILDRRG